MKVHFACLTLALAIAAAIAPVNAADWGGTGNGGIKDFGGAGGVPVPAPMPIPDYKANWYIRLDAGLGLISDPDVSETGFVYGLDSGSGITGGDHNFKPDWLSTDFNTYLSLGGGFGYYFGNGWRLDATVETRSKDDVNGDANIEYVQYENACGGWCAKDIDGDPATNFYSRLTVKDITKVDGTVWMMNAYYDLANRGRFTPYIGAGLGFIWNQISRDHVSVTEQCDTETSGPAQCSGGAYSVLSSVPASGKTDTVTLAAAAMAGVSFDVSDLAKLDVGYRYLYLGGTHGTIDINGTPSKLEIGDQHVHQVRAGLRFDID